MYYQVSCLHKFSEQDVFNDGCQPETGVAFQVDVRFTAPTTGELLSKIRDFLGVDVDGQQIDPCEDAPNRVDFQCMEDDNSDHPTARQIESWKRGQTRLWASTYTAYVEQVSEVKLS